MIPVSEAWQIASRAQFRYQGYLSLNLELEPPGLRQGTTASSSTSFARSSPATTVDGVYEVSNKFTSLEANRWLLNGEYDIMSATSQTEDWWSKQTDYASITYTFDKVYSIPGLFITWDNVGGTYPKSINIQAFDLDGETIYDDNYDYIDSETTAITMDIPNVKSLTITVLEWSIAGWVPRITEVTFGIFISFASDGNGRIMTATSTNTSHPLANELPTHDMSLTFRNFDKYFDPMLKTGISQYLAAQQIMKAKWGFLVGASTRETAPEMVYIVQDFSIPSDSGSVTVNFTNRLKLLDQDFVYGTYTGTARTLYSLIEYVLQNSGVLEEFNNQQPWVIDSSLSSITTTAPITSGATNSILQLMALAGCTWLTVDSVTGYIVFKQSESEVSQYCQVGPDQEFGDPGVEVSDKLQSITVGVYAYSPESTAKEIGKGEFIVSGTLDVTIKYNVAYATGVSATVSGGTMTNVTYYASYAVLTLSATNATVTVTLNGKEIKETVSYIKTYEDLSVADGTNVTVDNPYITSVATAQKVSAYVEKYYAIRDIYDVPYLGYPQLEAGDRIAFSSTFGNKNVDVISNIINFNGGWTGTLEVI